MTQDKCLLPAIDLAWRPDDYATLVFVVKRSQVLLIHKQRGLGAGKVIGPGGKIEASETLVEGALRELEEEVGLQATHAEPRGELKFQFQDGYALQVAVFVVTVFDGQPKATEEAVPFWCGVDQIPYDQMWADDVLWLRRVLDGEAVLGKFWFDGDDMQAHRLVFFPVNGKEVPQT